MTIEKPKIGKNVIETLTLGMYEDCRFIYREYVQNSADQIDKAVEFGILDKRLDGIIQIIIDKENKKILIEDNATGIKSSEVLSLLGDIAQSTKDRTKERGFRGIGRLGGLGYCKKLLFETSYNGETIKSIMIWDAKQLKDIIENPKFKIEAAEVISAITTYNVEPEEENEHYFKVILEDVYDEDLLDIDDIRGYLSQVAPIPFNPHFIYKNLISEELKKEDKSLNIDEYCLLVNQEQIFKSYTSTIYEVASGAQLNPFDEIKEIEFVVFKDFVDEIIAWGWYSISKLKKQIPKVNLARGLRLRKGNIQIGSEHTLEKFFKEPRFNYYYFGEIYAFSKNLIPNARRDYFIEDETCKELNKNLEKFCNNLYQYSHYASDLRSAYKTIMEVEKVHNEFEEKKQKGFNNKEEFEKYTKKIEESKVKADLAKKQLSQLQIKSQENKTLEKIYNTVIEAKIGEVKNERGEIEEPERITFRTDKLSKLDKDERKLVARIFSVIDRVLTPELAENLKHKIEEEFK